MWNVVSPEARAKWGAVTGYSELRASLLCVWLDLRSSGTQPACEKEVR